MATKRKFSDKILGAFFDPVVEKDTPIEIVAETCDAVEDIPVTKNPDAEKILTEAIAEDGTGIFRVKKLLALLGNGTAPAIMVGALEAGGTNVAEIIADGDKRIVAVQDTVLNVQEQNRKEISAHREAILTLQETIQAATDEIEERKTEIKRMGDLDAMLGVQSATAVAELKGLIKAITIKEEEV